MTGNNDNKKHYIITYQDFNDLKLNLMAIFDKYENLEIEILSMMKCIERISKNNCHCEK